MSTPDPKDQKAEALRRMTEKIEAQKKGAGVPKASAPPPVSAAPPPGGAQGGAAPPRARDVMAARNAAKDGGTPVPAAAPRASASVGTPERDGKDAIAAFNEQNAKGARILSESPGLPGEDVKSSPFRLAVIAAVGLIVVLGGYQGFSLYTQNAIAKDKAKHKTDAPAAPAPDVIPEPELSPDGHFIYPDIPVPTAEVLPTGPGIQYGNGKGGLNMDMVKVGVLNNAGEIEYVSGDDPRAKAAIENAANDERSAELAEESVVKSNTRPSENQSDRTIEIPKHLLGPPEQ